MALAELHTAVEQGRALPLMEEYYTIQGEGAQSGMPAYFIRLSGCTVGCTWCDVKESWEASNHPVEEIELIAERVLVAGAKTVVITGGEPAMYNLDPITALLESKGMRVCVETSGAFPLTGKWHWICFSPKKFKAPEEAIYSKAHELKIVVFNKHDLQWAETHAAKVGANCRLFLQPEWSKSEAMLPLIVEYTKAHPQWSISLQTHKYMNVP